MSRTIITAFILLLFMGIFSCNSNKQQTDIKANSNNVFAAVDYDKVIAYNYDGEAGIEIIDEEGQLAKKIKQQAALSKPQIIQFTNILCNKSTYGGDIAACFDPHLGIVYYKANKPVTYISICLDCNYLVSSIKIPGDGGFSETGVKEILAFEKELNFNTPFK